MAHMTQEKKQAIAAMIKAEFPNWSVRLSVKHHTAINVTIVRADVDLLGIADAYVKSRQPSNPGYYRDGFRNNEEVYGNMGNYFGNDTEACAKMKKFMDCVNLVGHTQENHDRSDIMTDYFDVGYYTHVKIGGYTESTKFQYVPAKVKKNKQTKVAKEPVTA